MSGHTQISLRLSRITMNQEVQGLFNYHYYTKYLDKTVWANSKDPDQTALKEQSDQGLQ